jgi:MYXO-CTERM domain-containing protein
MTIFPRILRRLLSITVLLACGLGHAAIVRYDSIDTFYAATVDQGIDDLNDLTPRSGTSAFIRFAGAFSYTGSTQTSSLRTGGTASDTFMTTNAADAVMRLGLTGIEAVGGNFFSSNISYVPGAGQLLVTIYELGGASLSVAFNPDATDPSQSFLGFLSTDSTFEYMTISALGPYWGSYDNLILAARATATEPGLVDEPGALALVVLGLGGLAALRRRRPATSVVQRG